VLRRILAGAAAETAICALFSMVLGCTGVIEAAPGIDGSGPVSDGGSPGSSGSGADGAMDNTPPPLTSVNKVDLLFDIDNSAGMGLKQTYLLEAIPELLTRLLTPNCVDGAGNPTGVQSDATGACSVGTVEFPPVRDLHIGIVSSSLGPRLGDACIANATQLLAGGGSLPRHNDDQGHLIARAADPTNPTNFEESQLPDAQPGDYLDWFPQGGGATGNVTPITSASTLETDSQELIAGVHAFGCGLESQLESWYRFLIQPDPYASLALSSNNLAQWVGVDTTILAQRADFLRPDSLVAILVLSDENDSEVDVRSFGGSAWNFMSTQFHPPRGTSACATSPTSAACQSCQFAPNDPSCQQGPYTSPTDWGYDLNLRHVHQLEKYGVSVQFPIPRYVLGLTSARVPDRTGEYPTPTTTSYQGLTPTNLDCVNPLFAAKLPAPPAGAAAWQPTAAELCNLPPGSRTPQFVYYAHIGGVPHQLLQQDPTNPDSPQKATLAASDWKLILGNDPVNEDFTGIDPHMVESYAPRTSAVVPAGGFPVSDPTQPEGSDPISGREWVTNSTMPEHQGLLVDLEYACTIKLATPRACDDTATTADPTLLDDCDCQPPVSGSGQFTHSQVPSVCNDTTPTQQDSEKAYPTIRELLLAQLLGRVSGANEGIISSICPIHTTESAPGDPLFGYRPAMDALVDRMKTSL
jgi:hypothetical protein